MQLYALNQNSATDWKLYASPDNGHTWNERTQPFMNGATNVKLAVSAADARAIYALAIYVGNTTPPTYSYTFYFSADGGTTWDKRQEKNVVGVFNNMFISPLEGHNSPVNVLELTISFGGGHGATSDYISNDGARTFTEAGANSPNQNVQLSHSNEGIVRLTWLSESGGIYRMELSTDGGRSWQPLAKPEDVESVPSYRSAPDLIAVPNTNIMVLMSNFVDRNTWLSNDGGRSWRKIGGGIKLQKVSPYLPLTILGERDNKLYKLDVADIGKSLTSAALASGAADSNYYPETRHNLSGIFKKFWEANGGLAQFGYPKTEPFREYNPSDGKVYLVQYYERNRFEYHPELAGTPYEVLLGLLGNQLTAERKADGDGAFNYFADIRYPGGRYFPETGHNLRNSFKAYWEANGGLSIYGYPTSEEFYEVNPDDGKTYVVQYFERNRFEYHPENKGTRYEVLLGLLGNTLLQQKGWL